MTNPPAGLTGDGGKETAKAIPADDDSVATSPGRGGSKKKDTKGVEKTWRLRFIRSSNAETVHPAKLHLQLIQEVQEQFGENVKIVTNGNVILPKVDTLTWTIEQHLKYFKIHPENGHQRNDRQQSNNRSSSSFIVHRIRSTVPLREIKALPKIHALLKNHKCYLNEHRWTEDVWDTVQLGFFQGINPQFYSAENATSMISDAIKKAFPKTKIPKFQIAFSSPQTTIHNTQFRTKAYAIETEKTTSMDMLKILKHTYKATTEFVPFQMRTKHPDAYCRILSQQTKLIAEQHVIVLHNISPDTMYYLSDRIASIKGVIDLKAVHGEKDGKHRVLVNKDEFHQVRKSLQQGLPTWYAETVADDAKPHPDRFPGDPEVAQIMSDGYSSGEDSYYSSSVNTAMSYDSVTSDITNDFSKDTTATNTDDKTEKSWAQRVQDGPKDPAKSSPKDAPKSVTPNMVEGSLVSDLASSRAEVDDLKAKLSRMQVEQETERKELAAKAEHQKRETDLQVKAQKFELEKKVEEQRRVFQEQMDVQRHELWRNEQNSRGVRWKKHARPDSESDPRSYVSIRSPENARISTNGCKPRTPNSTSHQVDDEANVVPRSGVEERHWIYREKKRSWTNRQ